MAALRDACKRHGQLTKECSQGQGQDRYVPAPLRASKLITRHLYAMYQLVQREIQTPKDDSDAVKEAKSTLKVPSIFTDPGYNQLGTSVLSTSNCGNPALRLFGFGPVTPEGYGIGYIIKEEGISICMSSKHLQTRRLLSTLQAYLLEVRGMLIALWKEANEAPEAFMDHAGVMRDARTGKPIVNEDENDEDEELCKSSSRSVSIR
jgi:carnitine O-acetyltransferase